MKCQDCMYLTNDTCSLKSCLYGSDNKTLTECVRKVYEHYFKGEKTEYDPQDFKSVKNVSTIMGGSVKPKEGGLWASPVKSPLNWKKLCENGNECEWIQNGSFQFTLKPYAEILEIKSVKQLKELPQTDNRFLERVCLDFEELSKIYDAIEVFVTYDPKLYWYLYGWDCDSILVMNPDVIDIL